MGVEEGEKEGQYMYVCLRERGKRGQFELQLSQYNRGTTGDEV